MAEGSHTILSREVQTAKKICTGIEYLEIIFILDALKRDNAFNQR